MTEGVSRPMVEPFARALSLLSAYTPAERWLSRQSLCERTNLPLSTTTRMVQTLTDLGYLIQEEGGRRFRLAPAVLALGYAATTNTEVQQIATQHMPVFADRHRLHVSLSARDRLDMIVLESVQGTQAPLALNLHVGARLTIASSPVGWALLAALPELERFYLLENVARRMPREWTRLKRRVHEAVAQMQAQGFCSSLGEWDREMGVVAAPLMVEGEAPLVLTCVGASQQMTRARVEREIGPQLLAMASNIQSGAAL